MTTLQIVLLIGLIGSFLMFVGDMCLYFDKGDYDNKDKWNSIFAIMKKVSTKRLYIGGLLGPLTAFLYAIGFYHIVLVTSSELSWLARIAFFICVGGIFFGGAYHIQTAGLGLLAKNGHEDDIKAQWKFLNFQSMIFMSAAGIGILIFFVLIVSGWTILPQWVAALSPLVLFALMPLIRKLPKGLPHMIICGGWSNLPFVIYFLTVLITISVI